MKLRLSIKTGGNSPWTSSFEKEELTIGRGKDADIRLHPTLDTAVASGIHARLRWSGQRWQLIVEHRNGATLLGPPGAERLIQQNESIAIDTSATLRLGQNGPELLVEPEAVAGPPSIVEGAITVRIISGFNSPWSGDFDSDLIRIGRSPEAEVRLHPLRDGSCASGIHARLLRKLGRWFVEVDHASGITVKPQDGPPLLLKQHQRYAITSETDLTIGVNGPLVRVSPPVSASYDLPPTMDPNAARQQVMPVAGVMPDMVVEQAGLSKRLRRGAVAGICLIAVMGVFIWGSLPDPPEQRLERTLQAAKQSVHMPGVVYGEYFVPCGTAWVADDRLLGTNGHVAHALRRHMEKLKGPAVLRVLSPSGVRTISITEITVHPGYDRWLPVMGRTFLLARGMDVYGEIPPFCDVAVLRVAEEVGPALPIASPDQLRALQPGTNIGYVGYPIENTMGLQQVVPPTLGRGTITRLADIYGGAAQNPEDAYLIQHDMLATGGSSGSPEMVPDGYVVGLENMSDMSHSMEGDRVQTGFGYGQRVDLLMELIQKKADENQRVRDQQILAKLRESVAPPVARVRDSIGTLGAKVAGKRNAERKTQNLPPVKFEPVWTFAHTAQVSIAGQELRFSFQMPVARQQEYLVGVVSDEFSVIRLTETSGGKPIVTPDGKASQVEDLCPLLVVPADTERMVEFEVQILAPRTAPAQVAVQACAATFVQ